jgi:hypothetical protein
MEGAKETIAGQRAETGRVHNNQAIEGTRIKNWVFTTGDFPNIRITKIFLQANCD